jgi:N-acetylglucosamine-6-phosphate deacetylase
MNTIRARLLQRGELIPGTLRWDSGRIHSVELERAVPGPDLPVVAPGFVDLHIHGFGGFDPLEDLAGMSKALALAGTTAFQPTLFPAEPTRLGAQCADLETRIRSLPEDQGARIAGLHLEGPFVSPGSAGALPIHDLAPPSVAALRAVLGPATGSGHAIRTLTVAPELPGAMELIAEAVRCGIRVSLGHSLASAREARAAARAGAVGATHLFNAMSGVHHRSMGLAGFALTDDAVFAELIGDLMHVGEEAVQLALRARTTAGLCLVSDALRGAGTGCALFPAPGREHARAGGAAWYPPSQPGDEPRLAGSALSQLEMVRRLVERGVVSLPEALTMASSSPARALGLERELGALEPGLRADFLVLEGPGLRLAQVWVGGKRLDGR